MEVHHHHHIAGGRKHVGVPAEVELVPEHAVGPPVDEMDQRPATLWGEVGWIDHEGLHLSTLRSGESEVLHLAEMEPCHRLVVETRHCMETVSFEQHHLGRPAEALPQQVQRPVGRRSRLSQ